MGLSHWESSPIESIKFAAWGSRFPNQPKMPVEPFPMYRALVGQNLAGMGFDSKGKKRSLGPDAVTNFQGVTG